MPGSVLTNKYAELPRPFLPRRGVRREPRDLPHRPEIIRQRTFDGAKILAERLLADDVKATASSC